MKSRVLGKNGPLLSALGLGCMGMSEFYGARNDQESIAVLHRALDLGVTFYDTADMYGVGHNEELVGKAFGDRRDKVFIATKFGNVRGKDGSWVGINGRPEYVRSACEASLQRLGIPVIDLYYQHRVDSNTPIEETVGAMAELVREGKVRYLGLSEAAAGTIRRAHTVHPITAVQSEYSLWTRDVESDILPTCRELGIGFVPYSPLGRGFLSGRFRAMQDLEETDHRRNFPRFRSENFQRNKALLEPLDQLAKAKRATAARIALAWVLAQGEDIIPIPGTKHMKYLEENIKSVDVVLAPSELDSLDQAFKPGVASGDRYPEGGMRTVNR